MKKHTLPLTPSTCQSLNVGDSVLLSGTIYTARDAAHKRLSQLIDQHKTLPFPLDQSTIYYVGPTPTPPNQIFGSAGPTTSSRMDTYAPKLYDLGVQITIGKGKRSQQVVDSIKNNKALYMIALGGAGALLSKCIVKSELIAFEDLGAEAIQKLEIVDFPVIVAIDSKGNNIYE